MSLPVLHLCFFWFRSGVFVSSGRACLARRPFSACEPLSSLQSSILLRLSLSQVKLSVHPLFSLMKLCSSHLKK
ncbi:hypothetical protein Csa_017595 [Cucumis sativus]|nr:hypothetical protein Csa_017595 [Cucumis sativus]